MENRQIYFITSKNKFYTKIDNIWETNITPINKKNQNFKITEII